MSAGERGMKEKNESTDPVADFLAYSECDPGASSEARCTSLETEAEIARILKEEGTSRTTRSRKRKAMRAARVSEVRRTEAAFATWRASRAPVPCNCWP